MTCVIAKHIKTNIFVKIGHERRQIDNKKIAYNTLVKKVNDQLFNERAKDKRSCHSSGQKLNIGAKFDRKVNLFKDKYIKVHQHKIRIDSLDINLLKVLFLEIILSNS